MADYYIAEQNVLESIEYFKGLDISEDAMLPIFLIAKHLGISSRKSVTFSNVSEESKNEILNVIWKLGGLQGENEIALKRAVLFPNAFKVPSAVYQAGTEFKKLVPRLKDTIEKKNIHIKIYNDNNKSLTLTRDYKELIQEKYLNGKKISLKHLASWVYRYTKFEFPNSNYDSDEFTRVIDKSIRNLFKIKKQDFTWLFEDDVFNSCISAVQTPIDAQKIRKQFNFDDAPEISVSPKSVQVDYVRKDLVEKFLQITGENPSDDQIYEMLLLKKQIVLTGVPGIGKSRYLNSLKEKFDHTLMIQFHSNYSYEEFIGGETIKDSSVVSKKGQFLEFIQEAANNKTDEKYLFIIDELNRGNIAQIFGETILALDREYSVKLAKPIEDIKELKIPGNVYIACSMNSSDRNIAFLDLAIRRRFAFIELKPNYELLSSIVKYKDLDMGDILKKINTRILNAIGKEELFLGHSYFMSDEVFTKNQKYEWTDEKFHLHFNFVILPTLKEYTFSSPNALNYILGENLSECLLDLDEFIEKFEEEFKR